MKTNKSLKSLALRFLLSAFGLSACLPLTLGMPHPTETQSIYTFVAQTIQAEYTLSAAYTAVAQLTQISASTPTSLPTVVLPTETSVQPTATSLPPTPTPIPTTAVPALPTVIPIPPTIMPFPPLPPPIPCDWAQYVKDVTVPDGTIFSPGDDFTKVWRMRNIGSCAWGPGYSLMFTGGDRMQFYNLIPLPEVVYPGESVDLFVDLAAPGEPGHYRGYWMLSNPYGQVFGIGGNAQKPFWVDIQVVSSGGFAYDFAANMCTASWRNSHQSLRCPGNENDPKGSVILLKNPVLETGKHENEPALWTRPEETQDGWIKGIYPSYKVKSGDHFMADVGCLKNSKGCDVTFYLDYQLKGHGIKNIGLWHEVYDGNLTRIFADLSSLAGKSVQFILSVKNNGKPSAADAFWLVPSIQQVVQIPAYGWETIPAVQNARQLIAQASGVAPNQVAITSVASFQWLDSCLGLHLPDKTCEPAAISGYRVILTVNYQSYEAHTNLDGNIIYWLKL